MELNYIALSSFKLLKVSELTQLVLTVILASRQTKWIFFMQTLCRDFSLSFPRVFLKIIRKILHWKTFDTHPPSFSTFKNTLQVFKNFSEFSNFERKKIWSFHVEQSCRTEKELENSPVLAWNGIWLSECSSDVIVCGGTSNKQNSESSEIQKV